MSTLFPDFRTMTVETDGTPINLVTGGQGAPLLLLHGYPQTHAMWHKVAPQLARDYTVVCADLRGYVQMLERWLINTLAEFGVEGFTREGRVGVWVGGGQWRVERRKRPPSPRFSSGA